MRYIGAIQGERDRDLGISMEILDYQVRGIRYSSGSRKEGRNSSLLADTPPARPCVLCITVLYVFGLIF